VVGEGPRSASVREGTHVVWASSPGRQARALLVTVRKAQRIRLALEPAAERDAVERLGAAWVAGQLSPTRPSDATQLRAAGASLGAGALVWLDRTGSGDVVARAIARDGLGPSARAGSTAEAAGRAVAALGQDGALRSTASTRATSSDAEGVSIVRRWWFWTAVGAVLAGGVAVGIALSGGEDRLVIEPGEP
jgi:hypothetical protein